MTIKGWRDGVCGDVTLMEVVVLQSNMVKLHRTTHIHMGPYITGGIWARYVWILPLPISWL